MHNFVVWRLINEMGMFSELRRSIELGSLDKMLGDFPLLLESNNLEVLRFQFLISNPTQRWIGREREQEYMWKNHWKCVWKQPEEVIKS